MTVAAETYLMQGGGWDHGKGGKDNKGLTKKGATDFPARTRWGRSKIRGEDLTPSHTICAH